MKRVLHKLHWIISSQFGINPLQLLHALRGLPAFISDWREFRRNYKGPVEWMPHLRDRFEEGGFTRSEYFWQDLLVARSIAEAKPEKHVDVGSRVDGFVGHVASFRQIEVLDVRPITTSISGIVFHQCDLMELTSLPGMNGLGYCDSLSCLHALEHFGLGRYGDPINSLGYSQGLSNMARLLRPGGTFYLSTPVGRERVVFNAHWVFDPRTIVQCAKNAGLSLRQLTIITAATEPQDYSIDDASLSNLAKCDYRLALFTFAKNSNCKAEII